MLQIGGGGLGATRHRVTGTRLDVVYVFEVEVLGVVLLVG